ncbi:MAG: esterase family protein [Acidobacteria bacterium]|nr:esterase family protein [Acidobacteriota bacterium]
MQALALALALLLAAPVFEVAARQDHTTAIPAASRLREETVQSAALGRPMRYHVLVPDEYGLSLRRYPLLVLLHGLTGDYRDWPTRSNVAAYSRGLPLVIVMPDGENSWYTNSAGETGAKFEDYILTDLIVDVEKKYDVIRSSYGRAVAGLSMGGFGALKMALKRPRRFVFAASFSGALPAARDADFGSSLGKEFERLQQIFGPAGSETRTANDVYALVASLPREQAPYIYLDCGTEDGLLQSNRELADALRKARVPYEYHELPGAHTWDYWDARIKEVLPLVMRKLDAAAAAGR